VGFGLSQTELGWLLDDSLAAWSHNGGDWRGVSWQQLERDLRQQTFKDAAGQYRVQLREPLEWLSEWAGGQGSGMANA
jgi:hypothetical protein